MAKNGPFYVCPSVDLFFCHAQARFLSKRLHISTQTVSYDSLRALV